MDRPSQDMPATTGFDINDTAPVWRSKKLECPIELLGGELYDFLKKHKKLPTAKLSCIYAENTNYHHIWYSCVQEIKGPHFIDPNPCRFHFYKVDDDNVIVDMHPDFMYRDFYNIREQMKIHKYEQLRMLFEEAVEHMENYVSARKRRLMLAQQPTPEPDIVFLIVIVIAILVAISMQ